MNKAFPQIITFFVIVGVILLGDKFGYKTEVVIGVMSIAFINIAFSLYKLKDEEDLSHSFLKSIFLLRGRREALFWGWFIWFFSLACFILAMIIQ